MRRNAGRKPRRITMRLAIGLLAAIVSASPLLVTHAQTDGDAIRLPNPDGRDPVFNESQRDNLIDITFYESNDDTRLTLSDFPARLRLINYWATWCVPCVRELPSLSRLDERYPDNDLRIVAISLDRTETQEISDFLSTLSMPPLDWYIDRSRQSGQAANVVALPTSILVDHEGQELGRIFGSADWESAEAIQLIESLLGPD